MWHGRHHSAQKSTRTGCALLAVSTSDSKFPSFTLRLNCQPCCLLSAIYQLPGFPLSPSPLIRCCNRYLVSCWYAQPPGDASRFVYFGVFRCRCLPRKILDHAVQLDALPDALVRKMLKRLLHGVQKRRPRILGKLEAGAGAVLDVEILDSVVETARGAHHWDG